MEAALRAALALERLAAPLARPLARAAHGGADPLRLPERLGVPGLARPPGRLLWLHGASVGEVAAGRGLAAALAAEAGAALLVTTATAGGAGAAPAGALHQFAPLDLPGAVRGFLDAWRPDLGVFVEGDLWPRLVLEAGRRGVPLALVNARASRTRARLPSLMGAMLRRLAVATAQDGAVAAGLVALGLDPGRVHAVGDLRAAAPPPGADPGLLAGLERLARGRPVWAAVSTHAGDEAAVAAAHGLLRRRRPEALLIWAPRHPGRGAAARAALAAAGLAEGAVVLDRLGVAGAAFRVAPLAFLGGSFGPEGGHNPWEPAALGGAVLSGPGVAHHRDGFARLLAAGGARLVPDGRALGEAVAGLLGTPELERMRAAARAVAAEGGEALPRTLALLRPLLARDRRAA